MTHTFISWIGEKTSCYWPELENKGFSYYQRVQYYQVEYAVGSGVFVPGVVSTQKDVAIIHCLYENPKTFKQSDRYRAIIEIFTNPKSVIKLTREFDIEEDIDIIQDGRAIFYNIAVQSFVGLCHIVYALATENPITTVQNYIRKNREPTYICRFKLDKMNTLRCAITNEKMRNYDHTLKTPPKKSYKVTSLECGKDSVKLRLKRQSLGKTEECLNELSPSVVLESINIEELKRNLKNPERQPLEICDNNKPFNNSVKENMSYNNGLNNSRRKQKFTHKMYLSDLSTDIDIINDDVKIIKHTVVTPRKIQSENDDMDVDIMVNKMKKVLGMVTPKKTNERQTPQRRRLPKLEEDTTDEPMRKTPKKNHPVKKTEVEMEPSQDIDKITDKLKKNLNIITPQKRSTPLRRRLSELQETEDLTKRVKKNDQETPTQLRKSTRVRSTPKITYDGYSSEEISTPSTRRATRALELTSTRKTSTTNLRNTPKKKYSICDDELSVCDITPRTPKTVTKKILDSPKKGTPSRIKVSSLPCEVQARSMELAAGENAFEQARVQLRDVNLRSGCLPCREQEYEDIMNFLKSKLQDESGGCMYISGVPGTGKTATVREIMKTLSQKQRKNSFKYISVNALSLTEPKQVYVEIVKQMCNKTVHWEEALTYIRSYFLEKKHMTHVLLIDELDKLCTRKQDVIYNLLDLPSTSQTAVVVITIANTMDLPERLLSNKVNSRLGLTRLTFRPYKHKELVDIVRVRLSAYCGVFRNEAIEYIARKVAAVSGDARRALAICTRTTEIAELSGNEEITMDVVNRALNDMASSPKVQAIRCCSEAEKLLLRSVEHEAARTGNDEVPFANVIQVIEGLCILESLPVPSVCQLLFACQRLHFFRLIISQDGRHDIANTILLNVSSDDIHFALKDA